MSMLPILNQGFMIHPEPTTAELKFLAVGDGQVGTSAGPAPEVEISNKSAPYYKISSIAQGHVNKYIVCGTEQPGAPFIRSDDRASAWQVSNPVVPSYSGFVERLHWIEDWQLFLGQSVANSSHAVTSSPDGLNWSAYLAGSQYRKTHSGFAFSPSLGRAVVAVQGLGNNIWVYNGASWYFGTTADDGGYSVIWMPNLNKFLAFKPGSQLVKQSVDGVTWTDYPYVIPVPCGSASGRFAAYRIPLEGGAQRILLFTEGGTSAAWISDDSGVNWTAAIGMENTGPATRYVAVDGNAVYVAFNAELNKGMISLDYGSTWERSDHISGNASGVIALQ